MRSRLWVNFCIAILLCTLPRPAQALVDGRVVGPDKTFFGAYILQYNAPPNLRPRDVLEFRHQGKYVGEGLVMNVYGNNQVLVSSRYGEPAVGDSAVFLRHAGPIPPDEVVYPQAASNDAPYQPADYQPAANDNVYASYGSYDNSGYGYGYGGYGYGYAGYGGYGYTYYPYQFRPRLNGRRNGNGRALQNSRGGFPVTHNFNGRTWQQPSFNTPSPAFHQPSPAFHTHPSFSSGSHFSGGGSHFSGGGGGHGGGHR